MIYAFWLIDINGLPIINRTYHKFTMDSVLFSRLLTAIFNFAQEVGGESLREVLMGNSKLLLGLYPEGLLVVLAVSPNDNSSKFEPLINDIHEHIVKKYGIRERINDPELLLLITREADNLIERYKSKEILIDLENLPLLDDEPVQDLLISLHVKAERKVDPILTHSSITPARYPEAEEIMKADTAKTNLILSQLADFRILLPEPKYSLLQCPNCKSTDVFAVNVCEDCKSPLLPSLLIEHFSCGFIGTEDQFIMNEKEKLQCPRCNEELTPVNHRRFNGYVCSACKRIYKEPNVKGYCNECKKTFEFKEAKSYIVYEYMLNPILENDLISLIAKKRKETKIKQRQVVVTETKRYRKPEYLGKRFKNKFQILKEIYRIRESIRALREAFMKGMISRTEYEEKRKIYDESINKLQYMLDEFAKESR